MKKCLQLSILIICFNSNIIGQNLNQIIFRSKYKVIYNFNNRKLIDDICTLDISKSKSYFYSNGKKMTLNYIKEKIEKNGKSSRLVNFEKGEIKNDFLRFSILKIYDEKKAIYIEDIGGQNFAYVKDKLESKRWNITNERATFNGLLCRKATMKRDTILITAWFSCSIPLQEGPLYFYGLPGLIINAKTNTGFEIKLLSTENKLIKKEQIIIPKYKVVSEKDLIKAKINFDASFKSSSLLNRDMATPKKY